MPMRYRYVMCHVHAVCDNDKIVSVRFLRVSYCFMNVKIFQTQSKLILNSKKSNL